MDKEKEIRGVSFRATVDKESRRVEGYALLFNTDSNPLGGGGFIERIAVTALDGVLEKSDVLCLMNHDERRGVLARYRDGQGSLRLQIDERGLKYSFDAPNTALGEELLESLRRGDISESSFAFSVQDETWDKKEDGTYLRTILKFERIHDVSPVYYPIYEDTSVALRGLDSRKDSDRKALEKRAKEEFDKYYDNLINRY